MSHSSAVARFPLGMGTVAALGSAALVVTAGVVLSAGSPAATERTQHGVLAEYASQPEPLWTVDDASLPDLTGDGDITVADTHRDRWLVSYTAGISRRYVLLDADTGSQIWNHPVNVGFGACAFDAAGDVGCAVRTSTVGPDNGFYTVDDAGETTRRTDSSDTASLVGLGTDFVHVNDSGYQVSRRSVDGDVVWSRTFASAATASVDDGMLLVATTDGSRFVLDPDSGADVVACEDCTVATYPTGLLASRTVDGTTSVDFHPIVDGAAEPDAVHTARSQTLVSGPATYPVLTSDTDQTLASHGRYQVVDPATGDALWQVDDPQLSKVHTRPCGEMVSFARKDRSRVFLRLADGSRVGGLPEPAYDRPELDIDKLTCVGASDDVAVFTSGSQLTAYRPSAGAVAWTLPINGDAADVDGRIVLVQGSTLSVLAPS